MATNSYRGVVRQGTVLLMGEAPLADGTEVLVTPLAPIPNTVAAALDAMNGPPHVPSEWVDELERIIEHGHRPPSQDDPFQE
jgi:hypothetical protein